MARRRPVKTRRREWQPLERCAFNPEYLATFRQANLDAGVPEDQIKPPDQVWTNNLYQVLVTFMKDKWVHLSIHRHDRRAVRDWRELQAIKNEVLGPERSAIEIFPPESRLVDTSNEYHLWAPAEGVDVDMFGMKLLMDPGDSTRDRVEGKSLARQRPWKPGLPTGANLQDETIEDTHV